MTDYNEFDFNQEISADSYKSEIKTIEKGRYNFVIENAEISYTKKGYKQIMIDFKITDDNFKNYHVFERFVFATKEQSEFNLNKLAGIFKAIGFQSLKLNDLSNIIGYELSAYVYLKFNEYFGKNDPQLRQFEVKNYMQDSNEFEKKDVNKPQRKVHEPITVTKETPTPISKKSIIEKSDSNEDLPF